MKRFLPALVLSLVLAGCATSTGRFGRLSDTPILFPQPPDTARIQFLFAVSSAEDAKGVQEPGWLSSALADPTQGTDGIVKPYGVALFGGRFYVCDTMLPGVVIMDVANRSFERWRPRGAGTLRKPVNCTIDPSDGRLYVADTDRKQIVVFDSTRAYDGAFGEADGTPTAVFVGEDRIWVTDIEGGRVNAYEKATRERVMSFPRDDAEGDAVLRQPTNLWVHGDQIYVSDFGDFAVKAYSLDGEFRVKIGSFGRGLGQFVRPKGVATDRDGNLFVVDAGFENVQVFSPEGDLLMFFGGPYGGPGTMWLPAQVVVSYANLDLFQGYVEPGYDLKYLILVTNQYGPDRLTVYGSIQPKAEAPG
jgi:DNA-binding beta-propeller fold protein YncE